MTTTSPALGPDAQADPAGPGDLRLDQARSPGRERWLLGAVVFVGVLVDLWWQTPLAGSAAFVAVAGRCAAPTWSRRFTWASGPRDAPDQPGIVATETVT